MQRRRLIEDYDLEAYAKNTSEFHAAHCDMARREAILAEWVRHIEGPVLRRYRFENGPVHAPADGVAFVARRLMRHYEALLEESA